MKSSRDLTSREIEVLRSLSRWLREHGYPPTLRELGDAVGLASTRSTFDYLNRLEELGYIRRQRDRSRTIEILRDIPEDEASPHDFAAISPEGVTVPVLGEVAAGVPISSERPVEGEFQLDASMIKDHRSFLMKVRGDSMIDAHICDGDLIVVHPQQEARNGEIVIVRIEGEITLKRFFRRDGFVELVPENPTMASILITPGMENSSVVGKLLGVIRRC